ncbi:diaminopimelate decarboxylase [Hippea maritima]|uniref:Diaminopimelate decarboxylase n=1 Tax=Hippea maritima (strain ATCC 700847 / DSM 10411 / MH2) TaxID=760142 RepID=F2LXX8_HIPMA|nr:diaminopimelate decarboxylase [Hippea maritima]AEA33243.1 diaminopimelate decarboxylase [Hippea maritima DSM 10411]
MFEYKNNELYAEGVRVKNIVDNVGSPVYVYSKGHFKAQFEKFNKAFSREHVIAFAIKSNSNLAVIKTFASLGAGADIVSKGELFRAIKAGVDTSKIVFSGVAKRDDEIEYALENDIMMINVESEDELYNVNRVAEKLNKKARIAFRVNPDVDPKTHPYISTGLKKNKFGVPYEEAYDLYLKAKELKNIDVYGIQFHIGSQLLDTTPIYDASVRVADLMRRLTDKGVEFRVVDVGGGVGIVYDEKTDKEPDVNLYARQIEEAFRDFDVKLVLEPGRFLVGNGGILVSKVIYHKTNGQKNFLIIDAGMNDLLRPSLYKAYHKIAPMKKTGSKAIKCDIVGPICETGDFFARDYEIEDVPNGNFIVVFSAGAYGFTMASNYNSRPRPAEVLVSGDSYRVVRERESLEDLIKGEIL